MHELDGTTVAPCVVRRSGARLATAAVGAAQAVDIKMWNLDQSTGYPEFIDFAMAEYKKTHPDVNIVFEEFPERGLQDDHPGRARPARSRPTSSSTGPARTRPGSCATAWRSTSPSYGNGAGRLQASTCREGWLSSFEYDGKNYGIPTDAVSKYFYYNKNSSPSTT